ncbi:MAG TPA: Ig-like domain-containing protein, partial [Pseudobdellovibrionaceae bacterium]|nr:Ig-like domain-containing protein [Pseudobdellovibrionaceae bacterium]
MNYGKKPKVSMTDLGRFWGAVVHIIPAAMLSSCSIDVEKVTLSSSLRNLIGAADGVQFVSGVPSQPSNASSMVIGMSSSTMTQARWIALSGSTCPATLASYGSASALPLPANVDVSSLPDGPVSLCAVGLNQSGQWQTAAQATQVTWIKDTTAPGVISVFSLDLPSASPSNQTTPRFLLGTLETGETAYVTTDSSCLNTPIATSAQASANGNLTATTANALTEGTYTFYSYRTDQAGNKSACSALTVNYQ